MATATAPVTGTPLPFKPQTPITPPPDCLNFPPKQSQSPLKEKEPAAEVMAQVAGHIQTLPTKDQRTENGCECHEGDGSAVTAPPPPPPPPAPGTGPLDPRYIAMVSRIAAYYQQRCQAISNFQHQKCQAWANVQRQKTQEMTQAALLVVAWYVRDRIQRRRKRQKRQFRRALTERAGVGKVKKEESVSKWASHIPDDLLAPDSGLKERPIDKDELDFTMDFEPTADSDSKLYSVADNMIKSQLARIDVPLMGALSFTDDEQSESESDYEELHRWRPEPEAQPRGGQGSERVAAEEEDYDDDASDYSYDDDDMEDFTADHNSERVHKSTGNNARAGGSSSLRR
ncbi:hypothetical protein GGTG_14051 [Gaeumannomyces tritici R3-111a-1]|uniref:Uncharacterized protein n=1 Tax=Gaeumannomyces tritici (strain R3-111a-1) TaxID=644352 RepID=J3PKJ5_GAET3|nr:hypothetical protein GGTG_14051 [Gaeumannomyces tritici R3-111a-1]EJT68367.1 hypothetical protein GGTG_14051 [Gaeumannomyces tritici R3-111a-1]